MLTLYVDLYCGGQGGNARASGEEMAYFAVCILLPFRRLGMVNLIICL